MNNSKNLDFRQRQVYDLLSFYQSSQIVGLFGELGTGKSTLIHHGLIPELNKEFLGIAGRKWRTTTIRPGISPLENLAAGIAELVEKDVKQKLENDYSLIQKMKSTNDGLRRIALEYLNQKLGYNYLIVIDNFEDIFHLYEEENLQENLEKKKDRNSFIQNISKSASYSEIPLYFLIILRSDFVSNIFEYRNLHDILSKSQYTIPQFKRSDFQEVVFSMIASPAIKINKEAIDILYQQYGKDLKKLKLLKFCLEKAIQIAKTENILEINTEILATIEPSDLYNEKLEQFYDSCNDLEKNTIEKIFKQLSVDQENSNQRRPIRIGKLLKVIGIQLDDLRAILLKFNNELDFILEIIFPYQDRLGMEDLSFLSENAFINIKNEQFVPHWPRLVEWIKQEEESREIYKRLSESANMFDQDLTGYLRPPDLDFILSWYNNQKPDKLWANQFNDNYSKTIAYLLASKKKFEEEIIQKEELQKQKIKQLRKTGLYVGIGALTITIIIAVFALDAKKQESIANQAREKAEDEKERARIEKERADLLYNEAQNAMQAAQTNEQLALMEKRRADGEFLKADSLRQEAEVQKLQIQEAFKELDLKSAELGMTVAELQVSDSLKGVATRDAENARAYQEALNTILSLRNKIQKEEYLKEEIAPLLDEIKTAYENYTWASRAFKGQVLPNNDLYQVLMEVRKNLVKMSDTKIQLNDLASLPNGIRRIVMSSSGILAAGGDDGILLCSKSPFRTIPLEFKSIKIPNERIRSLEFVTSEELVFGTVKGSLFRYNHNTEKIESINLESKPNEIIEQIVNTKGGIFVLKGGNILKVDPTDGNKVTKITEMNATRMFQFNQNQLLIAGQNKELLMLDINSLQWKTIDSDLSKKSITAVITSGNQIFLGMENGDVHVARINNSKNETKISTQFIIPAHLSRITSLDYDSATQKLFTASLDQKANIFDLSLLGLGKDYITNHLIKIEGFNKWIWDFEMVKEGKENNLLTVDENGDLKLWQTSIEFIYNELFQLNKISLRKN